MKLSYHQIIRGKPQRATDEQGRTYYLSNQQRVNLGWNWENIEADWPTVFELITVDGIATSAELNSPNRREQHFVSRDLLMVDIDSGMSIPELLTDEFYNNHAAGFYITPSHTEQQHRFRIMFRLATAITRAEDVVKLNKMLMRRYAQADAACKDATRIFYGNPNTGPWCERLDNQLSDSAVNQLIEQYNVWEATEMSRYTASEPRKLNSAQRQRVLDLLKATYVGEYTKWRDIGWGLKSGGYTVADWQYVTTGMMSQKTPEQARQVWHDGQPAGKITMGTVIWFLKQRHGDNCLQVEQPSRYEKYLEENQELTALQQQVQQELARRTRKQQ